MGRVKSDIPKGSFALQNYPNKKGEQALYLRYYVSGKYARRSTDIWLKPDDWDEKAQIVKNKNKSASKINGYLKNIRKHVDDQLLSHKNSPINFEIVQKMLDGVYLEDAEKGKVTYLVEFCHEVNEMHYRKGKYGYSVFYNNKCSINAFGKFVKTILEREPLTLPQLNLDIINQYVKYRQEKLLNTSKEGINKTLTPIVNAMKYASDNNLIDHKQAAAIVEGAYIDVKERKYDPDADSGKKIRYLSTKQFQQLKEYVPHSNSAYRTMDFLDIFFFSYYACGLRISDIITLEWSQIDFDKRIIDKYQVKTKKKGLILPMIDEEGMKILEKWKNRHWNDRFVFNLLPEDYTFSDPKDFKMRLNSNERVLNQSLNQVGLNLEFPFSLTMHVARHTFCVRAISEGLSLHVISQLMGHSSILATEKTYAEFLDETVTKEMKKVGNIYEKFSVK